MASPKVFVSSTCFDLKEIRESLYNFIKSFGFEPILSEHGDVFYHPDLHTHEACVNEISNCHLFILIIGGRFGGKYIHDSKKSVTNAEYEAAKNCNIPIFTYVKNDVHENHHLFTENKHQIFLGSINFPSIEKQEHAIKIFQFIDQVRRSSKNNGYESFRTFSDIQSHLTKQWAGMFFDYLKSRNIMEEIRNQQTLIEKLTNTSSVLENIVKEFYKTVSPEAAKVSIDKADTISNALTFSREIFFSSLLYLDNKVIKNIVKTPRDGKTWVQYLTDTGVFHLETSEESGEEYIQIKDDFTSYEDSGTVGWSLDTPSIESAYENGFKLIESKEIQKLIDDHLLNFKNEVKEKSKEKKK